MESYGYLILLYISIVFLPGIFWAFIDSRFSSNPNPTFTFFIAKSFLFGAVAYTVLAILVKLIEILFVNNIWPAYGEFLQTISANSNHSFFAFTGTAGTAIVPAMILTPFLAKIWFIIKGQPRLLRFFKSSSGAISTGGIDVWTDVLEPETPEYRVRVIDFENKRIYVGDVEEHSVSEKPRELFLMQVYVYNFRENPEKYEGDFIFRDYVYIELRQGNICVEFMDKDREKINDSLNRLNSNQETTILTEGE